jgi:hypothetical protein
VQRAVLPVAQVGYVPAGTDEAYVLLDGVGTRSLFDAVVAGAQVPKEYLTGTAPAAEAAPEAATEAEPAPAPEPVPAGDEGLTIAPEQVTVNVLNGTGTTGLAATVAESLRSQGFGVGTVGNEPGTVNQSVVRHGPNAGEHARTVAAAVPGAVLEASDAIGDTVQLVIGPGYTTVVPVSVGAPVEEPAPEPVAAEPSPAPAPVSC